MSYANLIASTNKVQDSLDSTRSCSCVTLNRCSIDHSPFVNLKSDVRLDEEATLKAENEETCGHIPINLFTGGNPDSVLSLNSSDSQLTGSTEESSPDNQYLVRENISSSPNKCQHDQFKLSENHLKTAHSQMILTPPRKRVRLTSDNDEDRTLLSVEQWEIPEQEVIDSVMNITQEDYRELDKFGAELRDVLDNLEKTVEAMGRVCLTHLKSHVETEIVEEQNTEMSLQTKSIDEGIQVDLFSSEDALELVRLRELFDKQKRSLDEKNTELENIKATLHQKEIHLVAATTLLGISFEDVLRKSVEAQIAQAHKLMSNPPILALPGPEQLPSVNPTSAEQSDPGNNNSPTEPTNPTPSQNSATQTLNSVENLSEQSTSFVSIKSYKDEHSRRNRASTNGIYADVFPLNPEHLKSFAVGSSALEFVRTLLHYCFTDDYLATTTVAKMNSVHADAIIDATLAHFTEYRTRKDTTAQTLNRPTVRDFMTRILQSRKQSAKRRSLK